MATCERWHYSINDIYVYEYLIISEYSYGAVQSHYADR